jgi:hypothetical protein
VKLLVAIKKYLESEPYGQKVENQEMLEFSRSLTLGEKNSARTELRSYGMEVED